MYVFFFFVCSMSLSLISSGICWTLVLSLSFILPRCSSDPSHSSWKHNLSKKNPFYTCYMLWRASLKLQTLCKRRCSEEEAQHPTITPYNIIYILYNIYICMHIKCPFIYYILSVHVWKCNGDQRRSHQTDFRSSHNRAIHIL